MSGETGQPVDRAPVIFLTRNLLVGGAERVFVHYVNGLAGSQPIPVLLEPEGDLIRLVHPDIPLLTLDPATPVVPAELRVPATGSGGDDDRFDPARQVWLGKSMVSVLSEAWRLRVIANRTGATAVTTFLMRPHIIGILAKLLFRRRLKVVVNVHEMMSQSAPYLYPTAIDRWLMRIVTRYLFPFADHIVAVSTGVKRDLVDNFGLSPDLISVVHNPIDTEEVRRSAGDGPPAQRGRTKLTVAAVGRLVHLKGFDLLLDAVARLSDDRRPRIMFIGDGPEQESLADQASRLGLDDHVEWIGARRNPWRFMSEADAVVISSRTEAFPNVIGEAFALGLPVLATDCSEGVREYLEDGHCGILVPPNDVSALAAGLDRLLTDAELRRRLSECGRQRVEDFSLATMVSHYESMLADVVSPAHGGP